MEAKPVVTVCICTRNRARQLHNVLSSLIKCAIHVHSDFEVLIVNNGSTDDTTEVVKSFCGKLPIREAVEPVAGLSHARNKGVSEARGDYICWTDDDVEIDENWLSSYIAAFTNYSECALFGGVIVPVFEGQAPNWFSENRFLLRDLLAEREFDQEPAPLSSDNLPYGANYAVRTADQRRYSYDPNLGVSPNQRRLGEETYVMAAMLEEGGTGISVPRAKVLHLIPPWRLSLAYVRQYQESAGETGMYLEMVKAAKAGQLLQLDGPLWSGVPRWMWRDMIKNGMLFCLVRYFGPSSKWLSHWMEYCYLRGRIRFLRNERGPA